MFSGLAAQHQALILREMRFVTLAKIDLLSLAISSAVGVVMALFGWRYWSSGGHGGHRFDRQRRGCVAGRSLGARTATAQVRCPVDASFWVDGHL